MFNYLMDKYNFYDGFYIIIACNESMLKNDIKI